LEINPTQRRRAPGNRQGNGEVVHHQHHGEGQQVEQNVRHWFVEHGTCFRNRTANSHSGSFANLKQADLPGGIEVFPAPIKR
jgi:hypothetical protein